MGILFLNVFWIIFAFITFGYGDFQTDKTFITITRDVRDSFVSTGKGSTKSLCDRYPGAKMIDEETCRCAVEGGLTTDSQGAVKTFKSQNTKEMGCFNSAIHIDCPTSIFKSDLIRTGMANIEITCGKNCKKMKDIYLWNLVVTPNSTKESWIKYPSMTIEYFPIRKSSEDIHYLDVSCVTDKMFGQLIKLEFEDGQCSTLKFQGEQSFPKHYSEIRSIMSQIFRTKCEQGTTTTTTQTTATTTPTKATTTLTKTTTTTNQNTTKTNDSTAQTLTTKLFYSKTTNRQHSTKQLSLKQTHATTNETHYIAIGFGLLFLTIVLIVAIKIRKRVRDRKLETEAHQ
uniref:Cnidarian restricted protein n=1 Tax=Clytia hemisphaerica TaxID=252671 RepID=A0A7M5VEQ3_9CNID